MFISSQWKLLDVFLVWPMTEDIPWPDTRDEPRVVMCQVALLSQVCQL